MARERVAVLATALLLALAALVAAGSPGLEWETPDRVVVGDGAPQPDAEEAHRTHETVEDPDGALPEPAAEGRGVRLALGGVLSLLAVLAAVVLAAALLIRLRLVFRRRRFGARLGIRTGPTLAGTDDLPEAAEVAAALDAGMVALREGTPRNAIVAAWVALERAIESVGVEHEPADTASDLVTRTLTAYDVDAVALDRLAGLYREARFSRHELTLRHRDEAEQCLDRLRRQLRSGVTR